MSASFTPEQEARVREIAIEAVRACARLDIRISRRELPGVAEPALRPASKSAPQHGGRLER